MEQFKIMKTCYFTSRIKQTVPSASFIIKFDVCSSRFHFEVIDFNLFCEHLHCENSGLSNN